MSGTDFYYESMAVLGERLSKIAPMPGPHKVYYGNSGAEAVECAMKLARYHTGRQHIIAFLGAFHGRTMGALSLTGSKPQQKRRFSPLVPGVTHVPYPYAYRNFKRITPQQLKSMLLVARATLKRDSSRPSYRLRKSQLSSSSRFRAKAVTWLRLHKLHAGVARYLRPSWNSFDLR